MTNRTFTMIKPDAMKNGHAGAILDKIIKGGFRVVALKQTLLTKEKAGEFYAVHKERPFYGELVDFMRYIPTLRAEVEGSLVWITGRVTKGPPSLGQQVMTGKREISASFPCHITC